MHMRRLFILLVALLGILQSHLTAGGSFSTVVIDAGHGGHNLGQSVGGVYEKWLTLDVSNRLEKFLKAKGVKTVMTRRTDVFIGLADRVTTANKHARDSVFVSIHFNGSGNRDAHGLETFYNNRGGADLAARVHRRLVPALRGVDRGVKFARYHVLRNTQQSSILVEGGFLTNSAERKRCLTGAYRQAMAEAIGNGILDYRTARKAGKAR